MNIIDTIEREGMKQNLPAIAIGDTVRVNVKVVEVRENVSKLTRESSLQERTAASAKQS